MRTIKKVFLLVIALIIVCAFFSCKKKGENIGGKKGVEKGTDVTKETVDPSFIETKPPELFDFDRNYKDKKITVVYFSATGNTKAVAEKIAQIFDCDTFEIEPVEAYTENDLTSYNPSTRPMRENEYDPFYPPEVDEENEDKNKIMELPKIKNMNMGKYDTIFLGYPIWFGRAPLVIYTFIKETNLKNKLIIPFCTSDNSEISPSDQNLANFAPEDVYFMTGKRFTKDSTIEEIKDWATIISTDLDVR